MLACPECGVLQQRDDHGVEQWHCQVGHRYSPESLADEQAEMVRTAPVRAVVGTLREVSAADDAVLDQRAS